MIYDFSTNNTSFIKVAKQLKDEGIKNYKFMLVLYDETLVGIDPFDEENLTLDQKIRIKREIRINPWYFLREVAVIVESGGKIRYQANRGNIALTFCIIYNIDVVQCLPRQNGKTIGAVSIYLWIYHFSTVNTNMLFSNKQLADSQLNIKRFNDMTDVFPAYIKSHLNEKDDTNNLTLIKCKSTNNTITAMSTARDEASADKLGRGCTVPIIWYDEFAFLKFNKKVFDSAAFALSKASESAKRNGTPYSRLITTTPNNLDSLEGMYCHNIISNAVIFDEKWYDMDIEVIKEIVDKNSDNDFVFIQFDYLQLGHDEKWLKKQKKLVGGDLLTIKREIFLEWTIAGDTSPFSEEQLTVVEYYVKKKPIANFYLKNIYRFDIFEELCNVRNRSYIISVDIAGGLEKDATVITIIDPLTYKPVCIFKSNRIDTVTLVDLLIDLVENFFNEGIIVPERNNMGLSVIQMLLKTSIARNLYYEKKKRTTEKEVQLKGKTKKETKEMRIYGIDTTTKSREIMVKEILNMIINDRPHLINNHYLFNEIKTLERKKSGKIEHRDGCHDDCLMSYLVGMYMILYGNNSGKFIKVTHTSEFDEEEAQSDSSRERINRSINSTRNILSNDSNFKKLDEFLKTYQSMTIDDTNHNQNASKKVSTNSIKVKRNINFITSLNKR